MNARGAVAWTVAALRVLVAFAIFTCLALCYLALSGRSDRPPVWCFLGAAVVVAVVLWRWQTPIERWVSRLVHRDRADAEATMDALLQGMSDALPVDEVVVRLAEAAGRNRRRAEVRVWLADGSVWGPAWPTDGQPAYRVDVRHGGNRVGEIEIGTETGPLTSLDRRLLDELAGPAGVALSTVRLTVDLRRREAELIELGRALDASTQRLRRARAEQRQRIQDEVGRRVLSHLTAAMDDLSGSRPDPVVVRREAGLALDELRTLARGIHPPRLSEDGLVASLDSWMERHDRLVVITGALARPLPEDTLRVAYFCVVTLLGALDAARAEDLELTIDDGAEVELRIGARIGTSNLPDPLAIQLARDRLEAFDGCLTSSWTRDVGAFIVRLPRTPSPTLLDTPERLRS